MRVQPWGRGLGGSGWGVSGLDFAWGPRGEGRWSRCGLLCRPQGKAGPGLGGWVDGWASAVGHGEDAARGPAVNVRAAGWSRAGEPSPSLGAKILHHRPRSPGCAPQSGGHTDVGRLVGGHERKVRSALLCPFPSPDTVGKCWGWSHRNALGRQTASHPFASRGVVRAEGSSQHCAEQTGMLGGLREVFARW